DHPHLTSFPTRRSSDLLVISDAPEVRRDFRDGTLRKTVESLIAAGGGRAGSIDMGILLRSLVSASPSSVSTAGIVVTNGVHWGRSEEHTLNSSHLGISY